MFDQIRFQLLQKIDFRVVKFQILQLRAFQIFTNQMIQIEHLCYGHTPSGQGQQILNTGGGPFAGFFYRQNRIPQGTAGRNIHQQQLGVANQSG